MAKDLSCDTIGAYDPLVFVDSQEQGWVLLR